MSDDMRSTVSIIGGSGYGGGELLRLLLGHPNVEIKQVTSRSHLGEYVYQVHPNLRKQTQLKFSDPVTLEPVDVLFLAQPHGQAQHNIGQYAMLAPRSLTLRRISVCEMQIFMSNGTVKNMPHPSGLTGSCMACPSSIVRRFPKQTTSAEWDATPRRATLPCCHCSKHICWTYLPLFLLRSKSARLKAAQKGIRALSMQNGQM